MSERERLTDRALAELEDLAFLRLPKGKAGAADVAAAFQCRDHAAKRYLVNLVLEVKERRALDALTMPALTEEERDSLIKIRLYFDEVSIASWAPNALATLSRLIGGAK